LARIVEIGERDGRLEDFAVGICMKQERAELVAEPQAAIARPLHGLDIEVGSGENALAREVVGDGKLRSPTSSGSTIV